MNAPRRRLPRATRFALIAGAALVGTTIFLMIRYEETGSIGRIEFISAAITLVFTALVTAAFERFMKKE